jgi:4-amino-4-deoxy-L-arabinose transferase-like glycosyltransferase
MKAAFTTPLSVSGNQRRTFLRVVLAIVLVAGTAAAVKFAAADPSARHVYNLDIDTATYDSLARQLSQTWSPWELPTTQPPGFVVLLAAIYTIFGPSYLAAKLVFCALLALTALIAAVVVWKRVGSLEGTVVGCATILSPLLWAYAATLQYEVTAAFLVTVIMAVLVTGGHHDIRWCALLASLCAVAALVREVLVVLFPICLIAALLRERRIGSPLRLAILGVVMIVVFVTAIGSWSFVQYRQTGRVVVISDKSDVNLRIGNNPSANGSYNLQLNGMSEPSGWAFMRERPGQATRLGIRKALYFWGLLREPWSVPQSASVAVARATLNAMPLQWGEVAVNGAVLFLFLMGLSLVRQTQEMWPVACVVLAVLAVHIVYFGSQRFAVPVQVAIYMVASLAVGRLIRLVLWSRTAVATVAVLVVWTIVTQFLSFSGVYRAEAEELEGISAENVKDPLAANGTARFGAASRGARPIAFLSAATFPRGSFAVRAAARTTDCSRPNAPALTVTARDEQHNRRSVGQFTVGDLCPPFGYHVLTTVGTLREDEILYLSVVSSGAVDVFVDRVDVDFGHRRRLDLTTR